jgi:hypothetical protein
MGRIFRFRQQKFQHLGLEQTKIRQVILVDDDVEAQKRNGFLFWL